VCGMGTWTTQSSSSKHLQFCVTYLAPPKVAAPPSETGSIDSEGKPHRQPTTRRTTRRARMTRKRKRHLPRRPRARGSRLLYSASLESVARLPPLRPSRRASLDPTAISPVLPIRSRWSPKTGFWNGLIGSETRQGDTLIVPLALLVYNVLAKIKSFVPRRSRAVKNFTV
jgi:hypothetical protein